MAKLTGKHIFKQYLLLFALALAIPFSILTFTPSQPNFHPVRAPMFAQACALPTSYSL